MIYFILGAFFGVACVYASRVAEVTVSKELERCKRTGSFKRAKPIIVDGENKVQNFIDETFSPEKEDDEHNYSL